MFITKNNNETGRFTTPDLLWSAFPAQTPYHYAYNSPLTHRDPTGLAPEKEKEREELLDLNPEDPFNEAYTIAMRIEVDGLLSSSFYDPSAVSPFALAFGSGGSGGRIGVVGAGHNGAYATMELNVPKNWDTESINEVCKPANNYLNELQDDFSNKEVGKLLRYDSESNRLFADFFIGESTTVWLDLNKSPYNKPLKSSEMIIGFVHTHSRKNSEGFSISDMKAFGHLSLGWIKWTNVPTPATFSESKGEVVKTLNKNSKVYERMYFGVHYSEGYESFSWHRGNASLKGFYQNINFFTGMGTSYSWTEYMNKTYNVVYFFKKKVGK